MTERMNLTQMGEKRIVDGLIRRFADVNGDDCAVVDMGRDYLLASTDMITAKIHFPPDAEPEDIGWHAVAVNLSDIAAMGGTPIGILLALGLPPDTSAAWLDRLLNGIEDCCSAHHAPLLGGDTKECGQITLTGTAIGTVPRDRILRRSGARAGDILMVSGEIGRALSWELNPDAGAGDMLRVMPRLKAGQQLAASGAVTSCIDMSDGLSTSLHLLAGASGIGILLEADAVPLVPGTGPEHRERALHSGGDYELAFTVRPDADMPEYIDGVRLTMIGRVTDTGRVLIRAGGATGELPDRGYEHFSGGDAGDG